MGTLILVFLDYNLTIASMFPGEKKNKLILRAQSKPADCMTYKDNITSRTPPYYIHF